MKHLWFLLLISFFFSTAQAENYKLVKIHPGTEINTVAAMGIEVEHASINKDGSFELFLSDEEVIRLRIEGISFSVLINNWNEHYQSLPKMSYAEQQEQIQQSEKQFGVSGFGFGSMGGYYTFAEVISKLDSMVLQYPNIISPKFSIGTSEEGRTIWAVKISDNPNIQENEPAVLYDGLIHAREPQAMATIVYYMYYLLENYGTNPEVTYLVNNREIYFVPVVNPDGYEYNRQTNPSGGGMWRKNRKNSGSAYGIDLNRNYGYKWGFDNVGSSPTPSDETYRGTAAFSEKESQVIRDFTLQKNFKTYINYHSYNNSIIYPWGYTNGQTPDSANYREFASYMSSFNGYGFGTSFQTVGYNSNGTGRDWMYGEQTVKGKIYGYVFEVGASSDGFWPQQSRIIPLAQANIRPNLYQTWLAGDYVTYDNFQAGKQYINPGDSLLTQITIKNKGFTDAAGVEVTVTSLDNYLTVSGGVYQLSAIPARTSVALPGGVPIKVSATAPIDVFAKLIITTQRSGTVLSRDTVKLLLGTPVFVFTDTTNTPHQLWTITSTPATPTWDATTTTFQSTPNSYTDSKAGNYANNATVTLTSTGTIDLAGRNNPRLTFYTKHDIEARYDCAVVLISSNNGASFTPLSGTLTKAASGNGKQTPIGMPVYEGLLSNWTQEIINLSSYAGQQIKLRFELRTDGSQQKDGWYLDDIGISVMGQVPVELTQFTWSVQSGVVVFMWKTATETNNHYFELQELTAGGWKSIGTINGKGTTTVNQTYMYECKTGSGGLKEFRLKQVDYSGAYTVYGPYKIETTEYAQKFPVSVFPNPAQGAVTLQYQLYKEETVTVTIYNGVGEEVKKFTEKEQSPGVYNLQILPAAIPAGIYYCVVETEKERALIKTVKY